MASQLVVLLFLASLVAHSGSVPAPARVTGPRVLTVPIQRYDVGLGITYIPLVSLSLGTPPQKLLALLDTGSSDLLVPQTDGGLCQGPQQQCTATTGHFSTGSFDSKRCSDVTQVGAQLNSSYDNGADFLGSYIKTTVTIGAQSVSGVQLGIVNEGKLPPNTPLFPIFGISLKEGEVVSDEASIYRNFPAQLKKDGITTANVFGFYMNDFRSPEGSVTFGGVDTAKFRGELKAAPIMLNLKGRLQSFVIHFSSMKLISSGNETRHTHNLAPNHGLANAHCVVDSGNPAIAVPYALASTLAGALGTSFDPSSGNIGNVPCSIGQGKSIKFGFNADSVMIEVPLELLIFRDYASGGLNCNVTIYGTDQIINLGSPFLQAAYVVFDMEQNRLLMAQAVINATDSNVEEWNQR